MYDNTAIPTLLCSSLHNSSTCTSLFITSRSTVCPDMRYSTRSSHRFAIFKVLVYVWLWLFQQMALKLSPSYHCSSMFKLHILVVNGFAISQYGFESISCQTNLKYLFFGFLVCWEVCVWNLTAVCQSFHVRLVSFSRRNRNYAEFSLTLWETSWSFWTGFDSRLRTFSWSSLFPVLLLKFHWRTGWTVEGCPLLAMNSEEEDPQKLSSAVVAWLCTLGYRAEYVCLSVRCPLSWVQAMLVRCMWEVSHCTIDGSTIMYSDYAGWNMWEIIYTDNAGWMWVISHCAIYGNEASVCLR